MAEDNKNKNNVYSHYTSLYSFDSTFDELNNLNKSTSKKEWVPDEVDPNIDVLKETRKIVGRK